MPSIVCFSASHCCKDEVIKELQDLTGYSLITDEDMIKKTADEGMITQKSLARALYSKSSLFNKYTREKEQAVTCLQQTVARTLKQDNLIFDGFIGMMIPRSISHVLKICLITGLKHRINYAVESLGIDEKKAEKSIQEDDNLAAQWIDFLFQIHDPWDSSLFDMVVPVGETGIEKASDMIKKNLLKTAVQPTEVSRSAVEDFLLSSEIARLLCDHGYCVSVAAMGGKVTLSINKKVLRLKKLEKDLRSILNNVRGIASLEIEIGRNFHKSDIYRRHEFEKPSRIMLVDDEREFVETLSERLEIRDMDSTVVHDGKSALEQIEIDAPDVMILDLKMSGVTGMEVLEKVKADHPEIEIIVLTGHGNNQDEERCLAIGAFAYLQKPVDIEELSKLIQKAHLKKKMSDR